MRKMGGLARRIRRPTGRCSWRGSHFRYPAAGRLLLQGRILSSAFKNGFLWVWGIGFVVAGMTAFYMFRLMGMTFWGQNRSSRSASAHPRVAALE